MKTPKQKTLKLKIETFRGDFTIGSIEQWAGIRNRLALWLRADRLAKKLGLNTQGLIDLAMNRCRKLRALRRYRLTLRRMA